MSSFLSFFNSTKTSEDEIGIVSDLETKKDKCNFTVDNYKYPTLYEEADEMLQAALVIYPFTFLRKLAREGKIEKDKDILLSLPLSSKKAMYLIEQNEETLNELLLQDEIEIVQSAIKSIHERHKAMNTESSSWFSFSASSSTKNDVSPIVVAYGDEKSEEELVYAVGIENRRKRITVAFRGSVTTQDFMTDACIAMYKRKNPFAKIDGQDEFIKIHSGFWDYLLGTTKNEVSKFDEITSIIEELMQQYPDYKLYVTGHSLGGALCTLFAFGIATRKTTIPKPITIVSVASPKVGNESWRKAFEYLEEEGMIRHLRIANSYDPITLGPPASTIKILASLSPAAHLISIVTKAQMLDEIYTHVGLKLKLTTVGKDATHNFSYATGYWRQDFLNPGSFTTPQNHFGYEYGRRLLLVREKLKGLYLNELYLKRDKLKELASVDAMTS